jgi:hypothetical protein
VVKMYQKKVIDEKDAFLEETLEKKPKNRY